nr:mucin-2-like [Penaeus vannamei]
MTSPDQSLPLILIYPFDHTAGTSPTNYHSDLWICERQCEVPLPGPLATTYPHGPSHVSTPWPLGMYPWPSLPKYPSHGPPRKYLSTCALRSTSLLFSPPAWPPRSTSHGPLTSTVLPVRHGPLLQYPPMALLRSTPAMARYSSTPWSLWKYPWPPRSTPWPPTKYPMAPTNKYPMAPTKYPMAPTKYPMAPTSTPWPLPHGPLLSTPWPPTKYPMAPY